MKKVFLWALVVIIISFFSISYAEEAKVSSYKESRSGEGVVVGDVISVDPKASLINVRLKDEDMTFSILEGETIVWKGVDDVELSSIKKDEKVEVGYYTDRDGLLIASWVDILVDTKTLEIKKLLGKDEQ